jgi:hypothetical protein
VSGVIIGVDPHKVSATIEVLGDGEQVLKTGRFGTDRAGYRAMLAAGGSGLSGPGQSKAARA